MSSNDVVASGYFMLQAYVVIPTRQVPCAAVFRCFAQRIRWCCVHDDLFLNMLSDRFMS